MNLIWNMLILSVAVFAVAKLLPSVRIKSFWTALLVAIVFSILNVLIGWLLTFLALPLIWITFGLFKLVINAFLLWLTDLLIEDFKIETFGWTLLAAVLITIIDSLIKWLLFA